MNEVQTLLTGRGLLESPRWHGDRLYVSDWSAGEVIGVDLVGHTEVIARVDSLPLCTAWLPGGELVIVSSTDGRLLRRKADGSLVEHRNLGRPGWNDIVVDGRGNAYVNGAGFNPMAGEEFKPGSVTLVAADGSVRTVADDIAFPNGMAVTPDNGTLIVADSYRHCLMAFDIGATGDLFNRRVWRTWALGRQTESASTSTSPFGTPMSPASDACTWPRGAGCCAPSTWIEAVSPARSVDPTGPPSSSPRHSGGVCPSW